VLELARFVINCVQKGGFCARISPFRTKLCSKRAVRSKKRPFLPKKARKRAYFAKNRVKIGFLGPFDQKPLIFGPISEKGVRPQILDKHP
jgi:hypothetical protein